jgi:hypothetical protein
MKANARIYGLNFINQFQWYVALLYSIPISTCEVFSSIKMLWFISMNSFPLRTHILHIFLHLENLFVNKLMGKLRLTASHYSFS